MTIAFNPTPKQAAAYFYLTDDHTTEVGYGGGAGGGKTWLGCFWVIAQCLNFPNTAWLIGRKELINLKRTTLATFFMVCKEYGIETNKHFVYNQQLNIVTFGNGSKIILMDLSYQPSDPLYTRLGGLELTGAFVDESNELPIDAISILKTRIGRKNKEHGLKPKLLETFNPSKNHVYYRYYKPHVVKEMPEHMVFIPALATDNTYLPEDYINQLRNADKITRERLLYGNFEYDDDPTKLFEYDKIINCFTNDFVESGERYITADIALKGSDKFVVIVWDGLRAIHIYSWAKTEATEVLEHIERIARNNKVPRANIVVDSDGVGNYLTSFLKGCVGFTNNARAIQEREVKHKEDKKQNYVNLKAQCYFELANKINSDEIYIHCPEPSVKEHIVEELESIKQDRVDADAPLRVETKDRVKEILSRSPDFADALMMRMRFELKKRKYVKIGYG